MLDKDCRHKAEQWMKDARAHRGEQRFAYTKAIEWYLKIKQATAEDHRAIAGIYRRFAVIDFKADVNQEAAANYQHSIQQLLLIDSEVRIDSDYRELTELYLDLADTCVYIPNQQAAMESNEYAIQAFNLIKNKHAEELALGDPRVNFQVFFDYFQRKSSTISYLASANFKNHKDILQAGHAKRVEEQSMVDLFGTICIDEVNEDLGAMMGGLAVSNAAIPIFAPIRLDQPSSDVDYRTLAIEYLRLTQCHVLQGNISDTVKTYRDALQALNAVHDKGESDKQIITAIGQQIGFLQEKMGCYEEQSDTDTEYDDDDDDDDEVVEEASESQPLPSQNKQVADSLIARMSMFRPGGQGCPGVGLEFEQDEETNHSGGMDWR